MPRKLRVEFPGAIYHVMSRRDRRRKSDPAKLALAVRLRRETTLTVGWMASRLPLGNRKSAAVKRHRWGNGKQKAEPDQDETMV